MISGVSGWTALRVGKLASQQARVDGLAVVNRIECLPKPTGLLQPQLLHETKIYPTPVPLSLLLGFLWLLGAGMDEREWHTAPWGHRQPPFTPVIGHIHTYLN